MKQIDTPTKPKYPYLVKNHLSVFEHEEKYYVLASSTNVALSFVDSIERENRKYYEENVKLKREIDYLKRIQEGKL